VLPEELVPPCPRSAAITPYVLCCKDLRYRHTAPMKMRLILLSFGVGLFLTVVIGSLESEPGTSAFLWLLVPTFLLIGVGGDRKLWRKTERTESSDPIWFAANS